MLIALGKVWIVNEKSCGVVRKLRFQSNIYTFRVKWAVDWGSAVQKSWLLLWNPKFNTAITKAAYKRLSWARLLKFKLLQPGSRICFNALFQFTSCFLTGSYIREIGMRLPSTWFTVSWCLLSGDGSEYWIVLKCATTASFHMFHNSSPLTILPFNTVWIT
jgi:hypothetical protein